MIVTQLVGGMGNQLFQYAAGLAASMRLGVECKVDTFELEWNQLRRYSLQDLATPPHKITFLERYHYLPTQALVHAMVPSKPAVVRKAMVKVVRPFRQEPLWRKSIQHKSESKNIRVWIQNGLHYSSDYTQISDDHYLVGFWNSDLFFQGFESQIREKLTFANHIRSPFQSILPNIQTPNSVSIHIRRGDKVGNSSYSDSRLEYIFQAIRIIQSKMSEPFFYVFSDDPEWCKHHLAELKIPYRIMSQEITHTESEDLYLMSQCSHHIIAASTFSWWAAWLNDHPSKIVISPKATLWFPEKDLQEVSAILPNHWMTI